MTRHLIGIQIIEVWHVEVKAANAEAAEEAASSMTVEEIRKRGSLQNIDTDHATVWWSEPKRRTS